MFDKDEPLQLLNKERRERSHKHSTTKNTTLIPEATSNLMGESNAITAALKGSNVLKYNFGQGSEYLDLNDIHPILRFQNFSTTLLGRYRSKKAWKAMRPALAFGD